jgi:hypothetical protein
MWAQRIPVSITGIRFAVYQTQVKSSQSKKKESANNHHLGGISFGTRALLDITFGPEVRQIFKIRTVHEPDVFLLGHRRLLKTNTKTFFYKISFLFI